MSYKDAVCLPGPQVSHLTKDIKTSPKAGACWSASELLAALQDAGFGSRSVVVGGKDLPASRERGGQERAGCESQDVDEKMWAAAKNTNA